MTATNLSTDLFVVTYRRAGWARARRRLYFVEEAARAFVAKLEGHGEEWAHLAPLIELRLTRRKLGAVKVLSEWRTPR